MEILKTIIPIFAVILLGLLAGKRGLITPEFLRPANRLTFYYAIPALVLRAIINGDFHKQFDIHLLMGTLLPMLILYLIAWGVALIVRLPFHSRGTFIEGSMHGNIGYIGFAVVFYFLGDTGLAQAGILGGFMMLFHNLFAVVVLQYHSDRSHHGGILKTSARVLVNPIILSATLGILLSAYRIAMPEILDRILALIGRLALPLALLVIGASLSLKIESRQIFMISVVSLFKLLFLPAAGLAFYLYFGLQREVYLPGLILLACPVATVVYILASELNGDTRLAVNLISVTTALSAITISVWLSFTLPG